MTNVRGRRGSGPGDGRRTTGRVPRVQHTHPVRTGTRSRRPGRRSSVRRPARPSGGTAALRRPSITGRAVLLAALILILALTLAGPVRQFLAGRAALVQLAAEGEQLDARVAELADQLDRQADPEYTAREARQRLTYVLPGDRLIMVVDGETAEGAPRADADDAAPADALPWYEGLLESLSRAAEGTAG